jgi:hypothetical protein
MRRQDIAGNIFTALEEDYMDKVGIALLAIVGMLAWLSMGGTGDGGLVIIQNFTGADLDDGNRAWS